MPSHNLVNWRRLWERTRAGFNVPAAPIFIDNCGRSHLAGSAQSSSSETATLVAVMQIASNRWSVHPIRMVGIRRQQRIQAAGSLRADQHNRQASTTSPRLMARSTSTTSRRSAEAVAAGSTHNRLQQTAAHARTWLPHALVEKEKEAIQFASKYTPLREDQ